jgi:aminoglycoside N3'-acetyltransferase
VHKLAEGRQKYGCLRYTRRVLAKQAEKLFFRLDKHALVTAFREVGIKGGDKVFVHASMNRMGYIEGGAEAVIAALMEAVGPAGSLFMPTFPTTGSMASYLNSGRVFDVRQTPSQMGVISETFRKWEGVLRSLHPTNPIAGWGKDAEFFLRDHHKSPTPYGHDTPFGRAAECDDTYVLMIETHILSLLHHLQERTNFPNLFLPGVKEVPVIGWNGDQEIVSTRAMRPRTPYFVAIPSTRPDACDWAMIQDFGLVFPHRRLGEIRAMGYLFDGYPGLLTRQEQLERADAFRALRVGRGEIGLLHIRRFLREVEPELQGLLREFSPCYNAHEIDALNLPYS